ncbi:MAG TPA: prephenate dehydrogenase/arogenate dehydrogenase family protein [Chloroflexota bacterium]|nr:prephenate dehydrogenase/arogenate dehydrogenase family protein [Chloroflexota bacterium]HUM72173.1 prephenate dehydrogenase/arogenate dehydrogenase family protein [Chloroflexota bacterium]
MQVERVCIVGLGLIGGSLALALRLAQRTAVPPFPLHLTIVDTNPNTRAAAERLADVVTDDLATGVTEAELVILATPVRAILHCLEMLPGIRPSGLMILDLGSSKADICAVMDKLPPRFQAVGGHPMAGKEVAGFGAATPDLFQGQTFILCQTQRTTPAIEAAALDVVGLVRANPLFLPPDVHDEMVAAISHLPYVAAATLMRTVADMADERVWPVSASGFRDTSRLSGTNPQMMLDILLTNRTAVLTQIAAFQERLTAVTNLLQTADETALAHWLYETQREYLTYRQFKP